MCRIWISASRPPLCLQTGEPLDKDFAFVLEPVLNKQPPFIVLVSPPACRPRINGQCVPPLATLLEKDQFQPDDEHILHVTLFHRPSAGKTPAEFLEQECPICRVPFAADTQVYVCPTCSTPMHLQGEETPETNRLECALMVSECPVCQTRIELAEGFTYEPELYCRE